MTEQENKLNSQQGAGRVGSNTDKSLKERVNISIPADNFFCPHSTISGKLKQEHEDKEKNDRKT